MMYGVMNRKKEKLGTRFLKFLSFVTFYSKNSMKMNLESRMKKTTTLFVQTLTKKNK